MFSLHRKTVTYFLFLLSLNAFCGNPHLRRAGAGAAGMGSVCIIRPGFWNSFSNQALLAYNTSFSAGLDYENRFNIAELGTRSAGVIVPAGKTALGIVYSHFGYSCFTRSSAGLACGLPLGEKISAGVQLDYFYEKASGEYGNIQSVTFEGGVSFRPSEKVMVGIHLFNPLPNSLRSTMMPSSLRAGAGIELSKSLFAGAEIEMNSGESLILKTGFEYEVFKKLLLRGGFCSENSSFTFGLGYRFKSLLLDFGFSSHNRLGFTSGASLVIKIK